VVFYPPLLLRLPLLLTAALAITGCTTAPRPAPPPPTPPVAVAADQYKDTFAAAVETLRRSGFRIDRSDYRFGVVTTRPEGSPTLLEPVTFDPDPATQEPVNPLAPHPLSRADTAARLMSVTVQLETRDAPGRRLDGRTDGRVFSDPVPARPTAADNAPTAAWKAIGRDPGLESVLQQRILARRDASATR